MLAETLLCAAALLAAPAPEAQSPAQPAAKTATGPTRPGSETAKPLAPDAKKDPKKPDLLTVEANIVHYTNAQRAKYGLAKLEIDPELMKSARAHATWMARNASLVHMSQPVAENIAMGQEHSSSAVEDWMNSSGHRANILNRSHRRIGVAAFLGRNGRIFWCQQFRP